MEFYAILDQVLDLLRRRGRVTYLGLKFEFGFDDALLEGVKQEILFTGTARDEQGQGLVWTGEALPAPAQAVMAVRSTAMAPIESAHRTPDAERRQLTVMFCDLADSTRLAQQLDPEDLREVIRAYQATAAAVIQQFDGTIAQYLGDGVLVYFGWPMAHEDDAPRAVHAGLGIADAITTSLNPRLQREKGVQIAVRIGIHTGPVVVGAMGGGGRQEQLATGDTVNIASRLEGLAAPNTVVISQMTARLVEEAFRLEDLGLHVLKGVAEPIQVLRVLAPMDHTEDEEHSAVGRLFLVGRDEELGMLRRRWEQSKAGLGQVVLLSGEAGIGKSALVETLRRQVRQEGLPRIAYRCSPYHTNSALYPVIAHMQRVCNLQPDDSPPTRLDKLERILPTYRFPLEEAVPLLASLLSIPYAERYAALSLSPQQQRQQTQDTLLAWLLQEAERQPVLTVWEDLHWADPSTLELLGLLVDQAPTVAMLHVLTFRPAFTPAWPARSHLTPITLNRLERPQVEALIAHLAGGKALPAEVVEHIVGKTDGVPLFVEELTKMLLESTLMRQDGDLYTLTGPLSAVAIPVTLQDSLMARLDQLPRAKEVAQLGAVLGREFAYDMLHGLSPLDESILQESLTQLVKAELLYQRGRPPRAHYLFKHALIQDAAYTSLLRSTRQQVHQQVAQLLEARFPEIVETQPELVAQHYTAAGCAEQAVVYWQRAGQQASDRSAYLEAVSHLTTGIELLTTLPATPERTQDALTLYIALGAALQITKGLAAPEVEHAYTRARELCQQVGETPQLAPVLLGLWRFYITRLQLHTARELGDTLLHLAQRANDPALAVVAYYTLGWTCFSLGALPAARLHLEAGIARDTSDQRRTLVFHMGQNPRVGCRVYAAWTLWLLGYPEQALACVHEALALAHELAHPYNLAYARCLAACVLQFIRDVLAVHEQAEATVALATEQGFPQWEAGGTSLRGWALALQGQGEEGLAQVRQGIAALRATGTVQGVPYLCTVLADVSAHLGYPEEGLQALTEAHTLIEQHEIRWCEAEVCRLRGVLLLKAECGVRNAELTAEEWLQQALTVARRQEAKSLELRAAMSLSRLWQQQGKQAEAQALLAPIYNWFTEGFDTADLQEARALLAALEA